MKTKPIIPWNAKEFFSNPDKYECITARGNVSHIAPAVNLDGTLCVPTNWQGMRKKTVIVEKTAYIRMFHDSERQVYPGSVLCKTKEEAGLTTASTFIAVGTLTWEEEQ